MRQKRSRCSPAIERLETRTALSAVVPAGSNIVGSGGGIVPAPRSVVQVPTHIPASKLVRGRHSTLVGVFARPSPGSPLDPIIRSVIGPAGSPTPFRRGSPFRPVQSLPVVAFAKVRLPGTLTTGVTGRHGTTGAFTTQTTLVGDLNGDGRVDLTDEKIYTTAFLAHAGDANYIPAADANRNGFIGHEDAVALLRNFTPISPKVPLKVDLHLAPGEQILHPGVSTSGGITKLRTITILGRTTPGAIIFGDSGLGDYNFNNKVFFADAKGNFQVKQNLRDRLTNTEYLVFDPFGQQTIRAFPILRVTA